MGLKFWFWIDRKRNFKIYVPVTRTKIAFEQIQFSVPVLKTYFRLFPTPHDTKYAGQTRGGPSGYHLDGDMNQSIAFVLKKLDPIPYTQSKCHPMPKVHNKAIPFFFEIWCMQQKRHSIMNNMKKKAGAKLCQAQVKLIQVELQKLFLIGMLFGIS